MKNSTRIIGLDSGRQPTDKELEVFRSKAKKILEIVDDLRKAGDSWEDRNKKIREDVRALVSMSRGWARNIVDEELDILIKKGVSK